MTNGETKQSHKYHYMAVFTGIATCLGVATVFNCAGIFFPYVTADLGIGTGEVSAFLVSLLIAAFLPGFLYVASTIVNPLLTRQIFGQREHGVICSRISSVAAFVTAVANSIWGFIIQLSGSYTMMWAVGLALVVLCLLLAFYALHVGKKMSAK